MHQVAVEVCVETIDAALAAAAGGADRIELCANLDEGGTTPAPELLSSGVARLTIPVFAMVRPRAGDFRYSSAEVDDMAREARACRDLGALGIVCGALGADAAVDAEAVRAVLRAARPLPVTFHRAFDAARDANEALDALLSLGVDRVLTAGGPGSAAEGVEQLSHLVRRAAGHIGILAAGAVRAHNARSIIGATGVREVHARLASSDEVRSLVVAANPPVQIHPEMFYHSRATGGGT